MLRHLGEQEAADRLRYGIYTVYREGRHVTRDLGGAASTNELTDAIIAAMDDPAWREHAKATNPV